MPKFIIPKGTKIGRKVDMELVEALGKIIRAGKKGHPGSDNRGYGIFESHRTKASLKGFGLIEEREVLEHSKQSRQGQLRLRRDTIKLAQVLSKTTDPIAIRDAFDKHRRNAYGNPHPYKAYRYFATAAGKKFYNEVQIVMGEES